MQTGLFRQDATGFVRVFVASDADTDGYSGSKCTDFSLHRFDTDTVLISALCSKQDSSAVSAGTPMISAVHSMWNEVVQTVGSFFGIATSNIGDACYATNTGLVCRLHIQVVLFGKGPAAGFPFGKASVVLGNIALSAGGNGSAQRYTAVSGTLGSASVAAIMQKSSGGHKLAHTVETISFAADAVANGKAAVKKDFELRSGYGGSVMVVP